MKTREQYKLELFDLVESLCQDLNKVTQMAKEMRDAGHINEEQFVELYSMAYGPQIIIANNGECIVDSL